MMKVNGFQLPNALVDEYMPQMPKVALQCYLFIARKTLGWHKSSDAISLSQFQEAGIASNSKSSLTASLRWLEEQRLVLVNRETHTNTYMLIDSNGQHHSTPTPATPSTPPKTKRTAIADLFGSFWEQFPKRVKRSEAMKLFTKLSESDRVALLDSLPHVVRYHEGKAAPEGAFVPDCPHPTTFIRGRRWEDEVYQAKELKKSQKGGVKYQGRHAKAVETVCRMADGERVAEDRASKMLLEAMGLSLEEAIDKINTYGKAVFAQTVAQMEAADGNAQ